MLLITLWAFIFAVISYVYKEIIGREAVLNWWFKFGLKYERRFFYRPIWGCEKCFSGQLAFWVFFFNWISSNLNENAHFWRFVFFFIPKYKEIDFNVLTGVFSISLTVFITFLITKTIKKLKYE